MEVLLLCIAIAYIIGKTSTDIAKAPTIIAKASTAIAQKIFVISPKFRNLNSGVATDSSCKRTGGTREGKAPTMEQQYEHQQ
jgi:hypothetical protein